MADDDLSFIPEAFVKDGAVDVDGFKAHYAEVSDRSFVPESFVKDGKADVTAFRAAFDDLQAFRTEADEKSAALPKDAKDYAWAIPDDVTLPEGFTPPEGFDIKKLAADDDPDIPALQEALMKHGAPAELMSDIARIMAGRELRALHTAQAAAAEQAKSLGPDSKNRLDTVRRMLEGRLPKNYAEAIAGDITTADTLRAVESLLRKAPAPAGTPGGKNFDDMTPRERIEAGLAARKAG